MAEPLSALSPSKQNAKSHPVKVYQQKVAPEEYSITTPMTMSTNLSRPASSSGEDEFHDSQSATAPFPNQNSLSRFPATSPSHSKHRSPRKAHFDGNSSPEPAESSPSLQDDTTEFSDGLRKVTGEVENQDESVLHHDVGNEGMSTVYPDQNDMGILGDVDERPKSDSIDLDDTIGDLSTFSAFPNTDTTNLAHLRSSPTRAVEWSPNKQLRTSVMATPSTAKRRLQLVSRHGDEDQATMTPQPSNDVPHDLLNFTGQSSVFLPPLGSATRTTRRSPSGRGAFPIRVNAISAHRSQASVDRERDSAVSPHKEVLAIPSDRRLMGDLLDFDLEPMATPRSIPTITPRELESMRSELQSQISSLSATLSGKEAEVLALKRAITDAEVRVGKTSEELRNERGIRGGLEHEKEEWERRGREMENVLREVRQEIMIGEREREKLRKQGEEGEKRGEDQELKILELQTMLESSRQRTLSSSKNPGSCGADIDFAVRDATERVARELHALYKSKHEAKVEALKKSYAARWEKQVKELQDDLKTSRDEIMKLQTEKDATMSGVLMGQSHQLNQLEKEKEQLRTERQVMQARVSGLEEETAAMREETSLLRSELEQERMEKGDLVAQVDLFLAMEATIGTQAAEKVIELSSPSKQGMRTSMSGIRPRPTSMLKQPSKSFTSIPTPGESRTGKALPGRGVPPRGGIMEGIARMGGRG